MPRQIIRNFRKSDKFPLAKLIPNLVTLTSLCIALSAIRFALTGNFVNATIFLLIAGFMDGIDGRLARFFNSSSDFGAQLDSLVDFVNFGVAPGFVLYSWVVYLGGVKGLDWAMVLFFAVCGAIRLARFNVGLGAENLNPMLEKYFFIGIPAPVGAAMSMLPMVLFYEFGAGFYSNPLLIVVYTMILGLLMASRVPTISIKKIPIRNEYVYLTLLILGSIIIGLAVQPWITLAAIGITYALSIPATILWYQKLSK
jgi:CDP-diacylglycerol--serine O-phosphatidyltransferase